MYLNCVSADTYIHTVADFATKIPSAWGFMLKYADDEHSDISTSSDKEKKKGAE